MFVKVTDQAEQVADGRFVSRAVVVGVTIGVTVVVSGVVVVVISAALLTTLCLLPSFRDVGSKRSFVGSLFGTIRVRTRVR